MKVLLLSLAIFLSFESDAQLRLGKVDIDTLKNLSHLLIVASNTAWGFNYNVDAGEYSSIITQSRFSDSTGKQTEFQSLNHLINHVSKNNWKLLDIDVVVEPAQLPGNRDYTYFLSFRKKGTINDRKAGIFTRH